ncbi:MAG: hypothetical protein ABSG71_01715 [Thermodesulfobacteriota bacterium]|jgi:hypothetical protein
MEERNCFRCGKRLQPGNLFYVVHIKVFSGFDGILSEPAEGIDEQLKALLEQTQNLNPKELEKEVYEEITWIVCKSCRDRFVDEIQHPWEGPFRIRKDPGSMLH